MEKKFQELESINEEFNIKYSSVKERIKDKLTLPIKYTLLLAFLPIIGIPLYLLIKHDLPINLFWISIPILFFIQLIGGSVSFLIRKKFYNKYLIYKIRIFNEFLILPKKYYFIRMGTTGNWSRLNIVIFFEDIESYKTTDTSLTIKFKKRTKTGAEINETYQKLSYLKKTHKDSNLPNGLLDRYPFLSSYPIDNLSEEQVLKIEKLLNKKQIINQN